MDPDRLREIVSAHVRRALRETGSPTVSPSGPDRQAAPDGDSGEWSAAPSPAVLAIFCGGRGGLATAVAQVGEIAKAAPVAALLTAGAQGTLGEERLKKEARVHEVIGPGGDRDLWELLDCSEIVLVAHLSRTTLARTALGLSDSPAAGLVLNALWAGKPVVVAKDGVDPDLAARDPSGAPDAPRALVRLYEEYLDRLEACGCRVVPAARIADTVLALLTGREPSRERPLQSRRVVTEEDVRRAARRGEPLDVTRAIVTPLARDAARELGVDLVER